MGDAHGVLGGGHALADHVDHDQVQGAVGQDHPVVEVAAGGRARVGRQVVDAELAGFDVGDHRTDRVLQLVHDLPLGRLELGQTVDRAQVLEGGPEVGGQARDRRLGPLVEAVAVGVPEQQGAVGAAVG